MSDEFVRRIREHQEEENVIKEGLSYKGPSVISRLMDWPETANGASLSEIARRSGYSKTYLSRIFTGQIIISKFAYLKLWDLLKNKKG